MVRKRLIEAIIGIIFLTFLLFFILVVIQISQEPKVIANKNYKDNPITIKYIYDNKKHASNEIIQESKVLKSGSVSTNNYLGTSDNTPTQNSEIKKNSEYTSYSSHKKTKNFGLYTDTFDVKINNLAGGQIYTIIWTFEDYWGNKRVYEDNKYIFGNSYQTFNFRDISKDSTYYNSWSYQIIPRLE